MPDLEGPKPINPIRILSLLQYVVSSFVNGQLRRSDDKQKEIKKKKKDLLPFPSGKGELFIQDITISLQFSSFVWNSLVWPV